MNSIAAMPKTTKSRVTEEAAALDAAVRKSAKKKADIAASAGVSAAELYQWRVGIRPVPWQHAESLGGIIDIDPAMISKEYAEMRRATPASSVHGRVAFTKERRASDDILALQIGLESLLLAVLQRTQGAAGAFLSDVQAVADGHDFSSTAGFLGSLVRIAKKVHRTEEEAAQARRRAGSAANTRLGKQDQIL